MTYVANTRNGLQYQNSQIFFHDSMCGIVVHFKSFEFTRHRMYQSGIDDFLCKFCGYCSEEICKI